MNTPPTPARPSNNHWIALHYTERMTVEQWKQILLYEGDRIFFRGHLRQLKAKQLGAGVVEIYKEAKHE